MTDDTAPDEPKESLLDAGSDSSQVEDNINPFLSDTNQEQPPNMTDDTAPDEPLPSISFSPEPVKTNRNVYEHAKPERNNSSDSNNQHPKSESDTQATATGQGNEPASDTENEEEAPMRSPKNEAARSRSFTVWDPNQDSSMLSTERWYVGLLPRKRCERAVL